MTPIKYVGAVVIVAFVIWLLVMVAPAISSEPVVVYLPIIAREQATDGRSVCVWEGGPWKSEPPSCWCSLYPGEPWDYVPMGCSDRPFPLPTATP